MLYHLSYPATKNRASKDSNHHLPLYSGCSNHLSYLALKNTPPDSNRDYRHEKRPVSYQLDETCTSYRGL